ncbi:ABC transporter permease [Arthrobacter burdickii]|uniref:ABC transporter permease n=1 Tax=Arthrobacter burdickii TaxID=3035920 RepID=A0ABT8JZG8_9MICC|nr:ABC transporter permease [Arthrobacter burdickii]MDN4609539.1 ABC transporter permease [Arthrobacter burdickii]
MTTPTKEDAGHNAPQGSSPTMSSTTSPTTSPTSSPVTAPRASRTGPVLPRLIAPVVLAGILLVFSILSPVFFSGDNLLGVLNQAAILALVAIGMTVVVRAGGIDLSIGVALDLAALAAAATIAEGYVPWVAVTVGLAFGASVGLVNAFLIVVLRIPSFLATLSVWFIGTSVQQLLTGGGAPIYLQKSRVPEGFALWGNGSLLGVPIPLVLAAVVAVVVYVALDKTRWGRELTVTGEQRTASRISGKRVSGLAVSAYLIGAGAAALGGVVLASRTYAFIPASGQLYVMDAIGAVFIGATLSRFGRVSVPGTLVGVLIFALLANGMNLIGLSFFWQGLARGVALLVVLLLGILLTRTPRTPPALVRLLAPLTASASPSTKGR